MSESPHIANPKSGRGHVIDGIPDESDLAGDQVLVESRNAIRGKGSGLQIDQAIWTVVAVREGKIAAISDFTDRNSALEAAGPSE